MPIFLFVFFSLTHCWSRGFYMMKPLTIAIGPPGLFWFNIECSTNFYRKSYWSDPFSVLWMKWLFKTRNSKPLVCWHWWCSRSWKTQKNLFSFDLRIKAAPASFLLFFFSSSLAPSFRVFRDFCVCLGFFVLAFVVIERATESGLWQCNPRMVWQAWTGMKR